MENGAFLLTTHSKGVTGTTNLIEILHERRCLVFLGKPMCGVSKRSDVIGQLLSLFELEEKKRKEE